jgi:hypothetical protein
MLVVIRQQFRSQCGELTRMVTRMGALANISLSLVGLLLQVRVTVLRIVLDPQYS